MHDLHRTKRKVNLFVSVSNFPRVNEQQQLIAILSIWSPNEHIAMSTVQLQETPGSSESSNIKYIRKLVMDRKVELIVQDPYRVN